MTESREDSLLVERPSEGIRILRMNRPSRRNALDNDLVRRLHEELDSLANDRTCQVVILTGTPPAFTAGLDMYDYGQAPGFEGLSEIQLALGLQRHISSLITKITSLPQPFIAAVEGAAAGGGLAFVLASDIRLSSPTGRFSAAFIRVGVSGCDIGTSWLLPRVVGVARAQELMLTGRFFDAKEALRIGLVTHVASDVVDLALEKATEIMQHPTFSVELTKQGMWASLEIPGLRRAIEFEDRQQTLGVLSEEHHLARANFGSSRTGS